MFTSYWRNYPWALQVALFLLMVFTMTSFGFVIAYFVAPRITGIPFDQIANLHEGSARAVINTALLAQFISTIFTFMVPAGVFAYLTHPRPAQYLGLRKPGKPVHWLIIIILILGFTPIALELEGLLRMVDLGANIRASQKEKDDIYMAYLDMPDIRYLIIGIIAMCITPAISEELIFRGVVMRFAQKRAKTITTPIFISGLLFALIHADVYGFIPIFISGMLLAAIYYLTRSLWCSMLAHALYNSLQVVSMYMAHTNTSLKIALSGNSMPLYILAPAIILFGGGLYLLWNNRTPLPAGWANDFNDPKPIQLNTFSEN